MPRTLPTGEHFYDNSNFQELLSQNVQEAYATGLMPRSEHPRFAAYGSIPGAIPFEESELPTIIDRSEWPDRIAEMDRIRGWGTNRIVWPARNQQRTNYCWFNGPCLAAEVAAALQGLPHAEWSAASGACIVKSFRNQGGFGADAVAFLVKPGVCSTDLWPNAAIDRDYDTNEADADRVNHRVREWIDVPTDRQAFAAGTTCLLLGYALAVGYNWWRHEVAAVRVVQLGRDSYGWEIRNSWGDDWGSKNEHGVGGFSVLEEGKAAPDDCQAVRQVVPSQG